MLIGITGKARSGKDTVANYLVKHYGFVKHSFAHPLKMGIKVMFGLTESHVNGDLKEEPLELLPGVSPRYLMQTLGTDWGRQLVRDDIWILLAERQVIWNTKLGLNTVMSDVRFDNEAEMIRKNGGMIVHVERPGAETVNAHTSEDGITLIPGDYCIPNDGDLAELYSSVNHMMRFRANA